MSGSVSLAPTNVRHDADRLHPLRRTESDRDLAYLIRTLLRFLVQTRMPAQLADCIGDSQSQEARICSVRSDGSSGRLAVVGSVAHLVAKDPGGLPRLRRSWQGPPAGRAGGRIPGALLAAAATGRCGCGVGHGLQAVQLFEDHHLANGWPVRTASITCWIASIVTWACSRLHSSPEWVAPCITR